MLISRWLSGSAAAIVLGTSVVSPLISAPALAQMAAPSTTASFSDINDYWAQPFIQALAKNNIISGYPDGTFRPNEPVDRAEFAAMIQKAFDQNQVRQATAFTDVPPDYWAVSAIEEAFETGFMVGLPGNLFLPNVEISKTQALVALASGLTLSPPSEPSKVLETYYTDAEQLPDYAINGVAAATDANIVVNYPNAKVLNPTY